MFCVVYLLRRWGEKLPPEEVRRDPRPGWLYFGQNEKLCPEVDAILYTDPKRGKELLRLRHASVRKIDGGGFLISGNDSQKALHWQLQTWWCVPGVLDDVTAAG